jgi:hypothetical protein
MNDEQIIQNILERASVVKSTKDNSGKPPRAGSEKSGKAQRKSNEGPRKLSSKRKKKPKECDRFAECDFIQRLVQKSRRKVSTTDECALAEAVDEFMMKHF